jgi:SAM-dependent methyltransferase
LNVPLQCPADASPLDRGAGTYRCTNCGSTYPVEDGIVRFLGTTDPFYEGAYLNQVRFLPRSESWYHVWPLWLINSGYVWRVRHHVPAGGVLLEIGCASGVLYFARRYHAIGLDVSLSSLRSVAAVYAQCLQADAASGIPLPDASVDGIASSYFWEHLTEDTKARVLAECFRVLRPGGRLIFLYDVASANPLIARLRRASEPLYREHFLERDGHVGYHTLERNRRFFEAAGFTVREHLSMERSVLQSPSVFSKMRNWPSRVHRVVSRLSVLGNTRIGNAAYGLGLRTFDSTVGVRLPEEWGRIAVTVCHRPEHASDDQGAPFTPAQAT